MCTTGSVESSAELGMAWCFVHWAGKGLGEMDICSALGGCQVLLQLTSTQQLSPSTEAQPQGQGHQGHLLHEAEALLPDHEPGEPRTLEQGAPSSGFQVFASLLEPWFPPLQMGFLLCKDVLTAIFGFQGGQPAEYWRGGI